MKIVYMNDISEAVSHAIEFLDKKRHMIDTWSQEKERWREEFGLKIERFNGDKIFFKDEKEYNWFMLRWS